MALLKPETGWDDGWTSYLILDTKAWDAILHHRIMDKLFAPNLLYLICSTGGSFDTPLNIIQFFSIILIVESIQMYFTSITERLSTTMLTLKLGCNN